MPPTSAAAKYKKKDGKDGTVVLPGKKDYLYWTPSDPPNSAPAVTIPVKDITNLQATKPGAKAAALKVIVGEASHTLYFSTDDKGWKELKAIQDAVSAAIAEIKEKQNAVPLAKGATDPARNGEGKSAAMAIAKALSSKEEDPWYDDDKLMKDVTLQRGLFDANPALQARFTQAMQEKPESVSMSQFTKQFWSARIHLLRAQAVENAQKQGVYNVLPSLKFERVADENGQFIQKLNIRKEQINLLFNHYPVVRRAYDNETPKPLDTNRFWEQFFQSRLLKKIKGEKILETDPRNAHLDKYLDEADKRPGNPKEDNPLQATYIPNWMNLEGNEQNHSQRLGNRPDADMRPSGNEKVPVLKVLNSISEKMMAHVPPEDSEAHGPIGMDEETFDQLRLQDLARQDIDNRVVLNIKEQQRYAGGNVDDLSADAKLYAKQDPNKVLATLRAALEPSRLGADERGTLRLDRAMFDDAGDESDSEDEATSDQANGTAPKKRKANGYIGSDAAMATATSNIMYSVKQRRQAASADPNSRNGLSEAIFDELTQSHNTTTEFLHYFWTLFLSGDASKVEELKGTVASLDNSLNRINNAAAKAEKERQAAIARLKEEDRLYYERHKRRRKTRYEALAGGEKAVMEMVRPTVEAINRAAGAYRKALEEQTAEASAAGPG